MAELRSLLSFMDPEDRIRVLRRYDAMFDRAGTEGEEALIRRLGSPVRQVLQIEKRYREELEAEENGYADDYTDNDAEEMQEEEHGSSEDIEDDQPELSFEIAPEQQSYIDGEPYDSAYSETDPDNADDALFTEEAEENESEPFDEEVFDEGPFEGPLLQDGDDGDVEEKPAEIDRPEKNETGEKAKERERSYETQKPGAGRVTAAVFVTIPMIILAAVGLAVSLALMVLFMAPGAVLASVGVYLGSYAFGSAMAYMPDVLLVAGGMLGAFCLALLFVWIGLWLLISGCRLTFRCIAAVYRGILRKGKEKVYG